MTSTYWPDLTLLPDGWKIKSITWSAGRATVRLVCGWQHREVVTSGQHHTPGGAFRDAVASAKAMSS